MAPVAITKDTFASTINDNDVVLVDFWAGWCQPCMRFAPIYDQASERHPEVTFAKVDTEEEQALSAGLEISSIPTVMAFREGMLVFRQEGALQGAQLDKLVEQINALDMEDLKKKAAAQAQA